MAIAHPEGEPPLLAVGNLVVEFKTARGKVRAVDGVSLNVFPGETLAIVGESGSGKSVTALSIMGLLPSEQGVDVSGSIRFLGQELVGLSKEALRHLRSRDMGMVFQDPLRALNPTMTIGRQLLEVPRLGGRRLSTAEAQQRVFDLLREVGVTDAEHAFRRYPHEYSGGMRQRVVIAMAIAKRPRLLLADEPTTALDVTIQAQILELLRGIKLRTGTSLLLITHDLGIVAEYADRVAVMYAGQIVEQAPVRELFADPHHPYTLGLLARLPRLDGVAAPLMPIPGQPPQALHPPEGCRFHPRCTLRHARSKCVAEIPVLAAVGPGRMSRCLFWNEVSQQVADLCDRLGVSVVDA